MKLRFTSGIFLTMIFMLLINMYVAAGTFAGGSGTKSNPYQISTPQQLDMVRYNLSSCYVLKNDINLAEWGNWEPIGQWEAPFTGAFDGNGYVIYNMSINKSVQASQSDSTYDAALFGYIDGGTINGLGVYDSNISLNYDGGSIWSFGAVGGIVGSIRNGVIEKCFFTGNVSIIGTGKAFARAGGLVGCSENSTIRDSFVNAEIYAKADDMNTMAGGITAWLYKSTAEKCLVKGSISGNNNSYCYVGGINASGENNGSVNHCVVATDALNITGTSQSFDVFGNYSNKSNNTVVDPGTNRAYSQSTYQNLGWDFKNTWTIYNGEYAVLKNYISFVDRNNSAIISFPPFRITINGVLQNNAYREYPFITYRDITYFPMTFDDCLSLGVLNNWSDDERCNRIYAGGLGRKYNAPKTSTSQAFNTAKAKYAPNGVYVNDEKINNGAETYPILLYKNVLYFPMTWRWTSTFGWENSFDSYNGLSISTIK